MLKGDTHSIQPTPNKMIDLLKASHFISIGRRWYFQCMRDLEDDGLIKRQRRWLQLPGPEIRSNTSLWSFTLKGMQYLSANLVYGARETVHNMIAYFKRNDKRFPRPSDIFPGEEITEQSVALARLRELLKPIGRRPVGGGDPAPTRG